MKIDVRKVQRVGYSTLYVSLPKDWVKQAGIKPGDIVSTVRLEDGSLKIKPGLMKEEGEKISKVVHVESWNEAGLLVRIIVALYLMGADRITLVGEQGIQGDHLDEIRRALRRLNGFSIVEETPNKIVIQSFIDPASSSIWNLVKMLHMRIVHMLELMLMALEDGSAESLTGVDATEEEIDRVYLLSVRQLVLANIMPELRGKLEINDPLHIPGHRVVLKLLEEIGDSLLASAKNLEIILKNNPKLSGNDLGLLRRSTEEIMGIYGKAFDSWININILQANIIINNSNYLSRELRRAAMDISNKYIIIAKKGEREMNLELPFAIKSYLEYLAQAVSLSKAVAESAINRGSMELQL